MEGNAAVFAVNTGTGTPAFTITMNANHTVAGIFNGPLTPNPCLMTISGSGIFTLGPANNNGFDVNSNTGNPGQIFVNNVIAGDATATLTAEGSGQTYLNGVNTYVGGTLLGFSTANFTGIVNFNNAASFGASSGSITISNISGGALVAEGAGAINIPNPFVARQASASLNLVGTPAGVTFSGTWNMINTTTLGSGGTGNLLTISGVMSGAGGVTKGLNSGSPLILTGANTYSGKTSIQQGTLSVASLNKVTGGSASSNLGHPTTAANGTLSIGATTTAGTLLYTGAGETTDRVIDLSGTTGGAIIQNDGAGALAFTSANTASGLGAKTLTLQGSYAGSANSVSGAIVNSATGSTSITKAGAGTWALSGASSYSGNTTVTLGTLQIGNFKGLGFGGFTFNSTAQTTTVASGATLDLNGTSGIDSAIVLNGTGVGANGALINGNAGAPASLVGQQVASATVTAAGSGITAPATITPSGGGGSGATFAPSLGVTAATFTLTPNTTTYTVAPTITISAGGGANATATCALAGASPSVLSSTVTITAAGNGFTGVPTVAFSGGTVGVAGVNPTITANATHFTLVGVQVTAAGSGYTTAPGLALSTGTGTASAQLSSVNLASASSIGGAGDTTIGSVISGAGANTLTKIGSGALTLAGVNTYSGATTLSAGKLYGVTGGSCASSAVEVTSGAGNTLGISIPNSTVQWTCASLTFDAGTTALDFNFGPAVIPSTTLAPLNVTGAVNFNGTPTVSLESISIPAGPATYPLIAAASITGTAPTVVALPPHVTGTLSIVGGNTLVLNVTANTEPLRWAVSGTGAWDINGTQPWNDNTAAPAFYLETALPGDSVVLDETYITAPATITLNATVTPEAVNVTNSTYNYTISGTGGIAGTIGLNKQGTATLTLVNPNTYTGVTTVGAGTLQLGDGAVNNGSVVGNIADSASLVVANPNPQTYAGVISGTGTLTESGPNTMTLSSVNTFSGATTISAGTLAIGGAGSLGSGSYAATIGNSGTFSYGSSAAQTLSGVISGGGALVQNGPGTLTLTGVNTYGGNTTVSAGNLTIGGAGQLGSGAYSANIADNGTFTYNSTAAQTLSGVISGTGVLVKSAASTLTLSGANLYSGGTTISAGTLSVNAIADSGTSAIGNAGTLTLSGGKLTYTGAAAATTARTVTVSGTASIIDLPNGNLELNTTSGGTITKTSAGTLTLSGSADNASFGLTVNGGTVILNKASAAAVHAVGATTTVNSGGTLQLGGTGGDQIFSGVNVTVNSGGVFDANGQSEGLTSLTLYYSGTGSGPLINNTGTPSTITTTASPGGFVLGNNISFASAGNITLAGVITNLNGVAYGITNAGPGTLTLSSQNRFSGGLTINAGATVSLGNFSAAGTNNTITINGNGILICTASDSATTTYTNAIVGGSTAVIKVNTASGNTYLGGDMTAFTGTIQCNSGQTVIGVANNAVFPLNSAATWVIANGATLDLQTPYITDAAHVTINGAGGANGALRLDACNQTGPVLLNAINCTIGNGNAGVSTISGVISDGGNTYGLAKVGANTVVLAAVNTYTGTTTNAAGILEISTTGSVKGNVTVTGGTLQLDGTANLASTAALNLPTTPAANTVSNNFSGTQTIAALNFGAVSMAQGTWGAVGSGATHQNAAFTGTGLLNVTTGGANPTISAPSATPNPPCAGAAVSLTATVSGGASPSGSVQFFDGVTSLGTAALSSGTATLTPVSFSGAAPHSITAHYLGDNANNPANSSATVVTLNVAPTISAQPANTTVCSGSAATFSVTASGSGLAYSWANNNNNGWSSLWNATGGGGTFRSTSTGDNVGDLACTSLSSANDINSPSGNALGMYGGGSGDEVITRTFAALAPGQVVSIDFDNGNVDTPKQVGFSLQTSGGADVLQFYFVGGQANYKYWDTALNEQDSGIPFQRTGLRVQFVLTSATAYSLIVTPCGGTATTFTGTYAGAIAQLKLFNQNTSGGPNFDIYFNNFIVGGYTDNADNYAGSWAGEDKGNQPILTGNGGSTYTTPVLSVADSGKQYQVTVYGCAGSVLSSAATVTVNPAATASAGGNQTICSSSSTSPLGGSVGGGATGGTWATSGTGTFAPDANTLNATYIPSPADITAGTVTLTLSSTGQLSPCGAATAQVVVTINKAATASAGGNQTICSSGSTAGLGGSVGGGATGGDWTTSGTGNFLPNATTLNATYTPSPADITAGTVTLTLTSTGQVAPCGEATASVVVTINLAPTASAGGNQTICTGASTAPLGGSVGGGATGGTWSTSGTGTFSPNATTLNATYNPSPADITAGTVTLTLTSSGQGAACGAAIATVVVTINPSVVAEAGLDQTVCAGSPVGIGGSPTASGGTAPYTYSWTPTIGLSDPAVANPTATVTSTTTYTVMVTDAHGCTGSDTIVLTVPPSPNIIWTTMSGTDVTVYWDSLAGQKYRVQYTTDLPNPPAAASWTDLTPDVNATGPTATFTDHAGAATQRFYRIKIVCP